MEIENKRNKYDIFEVDDIVFAKKTGYIAWPAQLIRKRSSVGVVKFFSTDDTHHISYRKIWPYNEQTKLEFITRKSLCHADFREAIFVTERHLGVTKEDIIKSVLKIINPVATVPAALNEEQLQLRFLHQLRQQHHTLHVEQHFLECVNKLRRNLTLQSQNYRGARFAFNQLMHISYSQLLIIRNFEAVDSIRMLSRFCSTSLYTAHVKRNVTAVRYYASELFMRFRRLLTPVVGTTDFWSQYCTLVDVYMRYTAPVQREEIQVNSE